MKLYIFPALFILTILTLTTPNLAAQQFGAPAFYTIGTPGSMPEGVVAADFNRDGHVDLAAIDNAFRLLTISLGNGDGSFQAALKAKLPPLGTTPKALAVGDFNNDGIPDLVVLMWNSNTPGWAVVWLGNGDGTFHPSGGNFKVGIAPSSVVAADFNGDGNLDIAAVATSTNGVGVALGNGDGTFQPGTRYNSTKASFFVATGDLNGRSWIRRRVSQFTEFG